MKKTSLALLGLLSLVAILAAVAWWNGVRREERLWRVWREEIFDGLDHTERYPRRDPNATARALEALAAEIGIDFTTGLRNAPAPAPEAAAAWDGVGQSARDYVDAVASSDEFTVPVLGPGLAAFLENNFASLARARDLLLSAEPPSWELHLDDGAEGPIPNLIAHLGLHRLLLVAALDGDRPGSDPAGQGFLEAAWRLGQGLDDNPSLIARRIHHLEIRKEVSVLRRLCDPDPRWDARLAALDLRSEILRALQLEGWVLQHTLRTPRLFGRMFEDAEFGRTTMRPWFRRLIFLPQGHVTQEAVERLRSQDPLTFDAAAFEQEMHGRIRPWARLSRLFLPPFDVWPAAVRTELVIEHTRRILAAGELLARGELPQQGRAGSTAVPGLSWTTEVGSGSIRIALDGDMQTTEARPVALAFELPLEGCPP